MNKLMGMKYFLLILPIIISVVDCTFSSSECKCHYKGSFVNGEPDVGTCANWTNYATCEQLCGRKSGKQLMDDHPLETQFCGKPKLLLPQSRVKSKDHHKIKSLEFSDSPANASWIVPSQNPDSSGTDALPLNELNETQNSTGADYIRIYQFNIQVINIDHTISHIPALDQSNASTPATREIKNGTQACHCPLTLNDRLDLLCPLKVCKSFFKTVKCRKSCGIWDGLDAFVQKCAEFGVYPNSSTRIEVIGLAKAFVVMYQIFVHIIYVN